MTRNVQTLRGLAATTGRTEGADVIDRTNLPLRAPQVVDNHTRIFVLCSAAGFSAIAAVVVIVVVKFLL